MSILVLGIHIKEMRIWKIEVASNAKKISRNRQIITCLEGRTMVRRQKGNLRFFFFDIR